MKIIMKPWQQPTIDWATTINGIVRSKNGWQQTIEAWSQTKRQRNSRIVATAVSWQWQASLQLQASSQQQQKRILVWNRDKHCRYKHRRMNKNWNQALSQTSIVANKSSIVATSFVATRIVAKQKQETSSLETNKNHWVATNIIATSKKGIAGIKQASSQQPCIVGNKNCCNKQQGTALLPTKKGL